MRRTFNRADPGGRLIRHLKDGRPHITVQLSGDELARALEQLARDKGVPAPPDEDEPEKP